MLSFICLLATLLSASEKPMTTTAPTFAEVQDVSNLPLLNPDLKERKTDKLQLSNGLNVLLISDPAADQSAAAVAVQAGSWDDPAEYPGMAHFCEHMLFRGSEKYPTDEEEFMKCVADSGGSCNAFTAPDRTVYMFSSKEADFFQNLDQFARFFIDPLLRQSHIARELHAVDQEHSKNLEHDGWREYMVFKELNCDGHPNRKFSTGNAQTLGKIPATALKQWYETHYTAERMHLVLYSSLPLDTLRSSVATAFADVRTGSASRTRPTGPLTSTAQRGQIVYIKPVQERRMLTLLWELPPEFIDDPTHSAELLAYALGRGYRASLSECLTREGLINEMRVHVEKMGHHPLLDITLELTPQGVRDVQRVGTHCFEALQRFKTDGVPSWLFDERSRLEALNYQYQPRTNAFEMVQNLAQMLPDEPLATFPRAQLLGSGYDADKIQQLLGSLTPATCCMALAAPPSVTGVEPTVKERWMQAEYTVRPLPEAWKKTWEIASVNPAIQVGEPNPFVPEKFDVAASGSATPQLLASSPAGVAYYARVPEFTAPEASMRLHIRSKVLDASPRAAVLGALYLDHLTDVVHPTLLAAKAAGLNATFGLERFQLHVTLHGFSDKAAVLLQEIVKQMPQNPPTAELFAKYAERHEKAYTNKARELPVMQAKCELDALLLRENVLPTVALDALRQIKHEDLVAFHQKFLEATYIEALFAGNLTETDAKSAWLDVQHALNNGALAQSEFILPEVLELPESGGPFELARSTAAQGNGAILAIDLGPFDFERRAVQEINGAALGEAFFNELRTKQKTGYIAKASPTELEGRLFQLFLVQSSSHQPQDLLYRYELFLEEYLETLTTSLPPERFEVLRDSSIRSLQTRYRNLEDKSALWDLLAFEKGADFQYVDKRIEALKALPYQKFLDVVGEMLSRANRRRVAVLVEGRVRAPFAYETVEPKQLAERGRYTASRR